MINLNLHLRNKHFLGFQVGLGIVGGLGLIVIEIIYKKHQLRKQKHVVAAKTAVKKWRGTIEVSRQTFIQILAQVFILTKK